MLTAAQRAALVALRSEQRRLNATYLDLPAAANTGGCHLVAPEAAALLSKLGATHRSGYFDARALGDETAVDHHWVALPDGTIIDPTADTFGCGELGIAVIAPCDPAARRYREYGALPADVDDADGPPPASAVFATAAP